MCGVVGIAGKSPVNQMLFDALTMLQHRGQDAANQALHHIKSEDAEKSSDYSSESQNKHGRSGSGESTNNPFY